MSDAMDNEMTGVEIAIVGMAGRFPDAPDVEAFWRNIRDGVESVRTFDDEALRARGVSAELLADPGYVRAGVVLEDMDRFDAGFFGYSPRDAEQLDPQQRLFLETAWQALEHAGYAGAAPALTGVYAGSGASLYLLRHLLPAVDWRTSDVSSLLGLMNGNDKDSLATRVAYKLDLRGPAVSVQTACSTSLAAVHLACRGLLNYEADMALAGGVWLNLLQEGGYRYQPGAILSPDGHCRAFDAEAAGTVLGSGAGIVVLKRLADALADGDTVHAVIKGSALNNDGAAKVGYTAPSVDGQAEAILAAQAMAGVSADSIGYVETHGTGTSLGDPIEIAALTQAFRASSQRRGYCAIGSVKTNIGHLDAAAGVTGLIKAALALGHRTLPPSLNFREPNPQIDFAESPFYVNTGARPWPACEGPRRAGVSSFGMGGTNVHVILEEAPAPSAARQGDGLRLLALSARSEAALDAVAGRLAAHLKQHPQQALADVAHTLHAGRERFAQRAVALARDPADAARVLEARAPDAFFSGRVLSERPTLAFLFPGQGAQHLDMGRALYEREALFRETLDRCCALLAPHLGLDLRELLFAAAADESAAAARLEQTAITQPALFAVEYAMAQLWMSWGVQPDALLGHSIGEYVAACLAGVFTLEDALALVAARGRLLQATEAGAMLAVSLPEAELCARLPAGCDLAAVNAADLCVLAGPIPAIEAAERQLAERGVGVRRLHVSRAFHSALVEPMLGEFESLLSRIALGAPRIPFVSNLSGRWITAEEACSPGYWVRHVRGTVRFADGLDELLGKPDRILLEVGPGETLTSLARRHRQAGARPVLASQCHPQRRALNAEQPARCLAQLWLAGLAIDVPGLFGGERARRVPLPTYPFERQSYWIAAPGGAAGRALPPATGRREVADWFHVPAWTRSEAAEPTQQSGSVLLLGDAHGLGERLARHLQAAQRPVIRVERGAQFARLGERHYALRPAERDDFERLLRAVEAESGPLADICHLWSLDPAGLPAPDEALERGFHSLLALAQALEATAPADGRQSVVLSVVANQLEDVAGSEPLCAEKATLHGPCKVIPLEYPHIACRLVDVVLPPAGDVAEERLAGQLAAELATRIEPQEGTPVLAFRGPHRWRKTFESVRRDGAASPRLRRQGVYLITGGLGGIGLALARHLAGNWQARLVLLGRSALPPRDQWPACLAAADRDAALAARLQQLLELEALGAEVLVLQADVADPAQLRQAVDAARRRFGALHGVIHAAGAAGGGLLAGRTRAEAGRVFVPKLQGTRNLLEALAGEAPDFVLLCSSLTAITGAFGQADYCAANCFLDALAAKASRQGDGFVLSVNWDTWRETGMAAGQRLPEEVGITAEQGGRLLEALLGGPQTAQVLVSSLDLERQFAQVRSSELAGRLLPEPAARRQRHARPALQTAYLAPEGELEEDLAALWSEFLGISPIGVDDNLFELGGDSLLAIQLLARVRSAYGVELHPAALFKTPTVAALAMLVETRLIEEIENAETA
ncbi:SDR family NAD(P)-dependent oxidoreductase [Azotobacter chroococcum]|uniref:Phenolphthiocerol/phthiocerol polyketide synthase subunit E n=1 Tax=Azotobacter chroococcum TaxID=353 RepID=A0AA43Z539_9GAMM|nr:type I polyketide synthase [Azotobacter chroococcum]NHN76931.1 SDR family NAD(P)-dependent oxidoreductase [Azotobacter chroococcum]